MNRWRIGAVLWLTLWGCDAAPPPSPPPDMAALVTQVLALPGDPERGAAVFRERCIHCHGDQAAGEPPTDFDLGTENPRRFRGFDELDRRQHTQVVVQGYVSEQSGKQNMPAFALRLKPAQMADVIAYERAIMAQQGAYWENNRRSWWPRTPEPVRPPGY